MPFGMKTAPQTYQRLMELVLSGLQWTACLIYLDDVVMYGEAFDEHLQRLSVVLQWIWQAGMKLKPSKCHFFETHITFLGHVLTPNEVLPDTDNVKKIKMWPVWTCVIDVWVILGMRNCYWWFNKRLLQDNAASNSVDKEGQKLWVDSRMQEANWPAERSID